MSDVADMLRPSRRGAIAMGVFAFALPIVLLIPFTNKAFHIDDTVYVWVAKQIVEDPFDPYGFDMNWEGTAVPVYTFNQNPPGVSYYLAALGSVFGWDEAVLHLGMAIMAGLLSLGTYLLARDFCARPMLAVLVAITSPAVYVSSTSVMSDVPMAAYYVWAIYLWKSGLDRKAGLLLVASTICISLSLLHKYFGLTAIPLLVLYTFARGRRPGAWLLYFVLPIVTLAGYQLMTNRMYGISLFSEAAQYTVKFSMSDTSEAFIAKLGLGLSFFGGCYIATMLYAAVVWPRRRIVLGVLAVCFLCWIVAMSGAVGRYRFDYLLAHHWLVIVHFGFFIGASLHFVALLTLDAWRTRDASVVLLVAWIVGTFLFASFINWSVNARTMLPMAPAVGIVLARFLESRDFEGPGRWLKFYGPALLGVMISFWVALGDFYFAEAQRRAARKFGQDNRALGVDYYHSGHWGFQYYMDEEGIAPWDSVGLRVQVGDRVVIPQNNAFPPKMNSDVARAWYDLRHTEKMSAGVSLMHLHRGAGFYTHFWGPVPYAFGSVPEEIYAVYELGDFRGLSEPDAPGR